MSLLKACGRGLRGFGQWLLRQIKSHFITGLIITVPLVIIALILVWLFNTIDGILQPIIKDIVGHNITGVGFVALLLLIYIIGLITSNIFGKRAYSYIERFLFYRIPVVKQLYQGIKQILQSFSPSQTSRFLQVVMIEFPRKGIWTLGFLTNKVKDKDGNTLLYVFMPHVPNPTSGYIQIMREEDAIYTNISVEEAFKMVVSVGRYSPEDSTIADQILAHGSTKPAANDTATEDTPADKHT
jgi:uncharacterized membrane protein